MAAKVLSPRARYRAQTRAEIKEIALRQLAEGGAEAIALTRIAQEIGLSGPALYRYFASRDELVSELVMDAYGDAAAAIEARMQRISPETAPRDALVALADTYLEWAQAQPHRYLLIQGSPLPGYAAPPESVARARSTLGPFLKIFASGTPSREVQPLVKEMASWVRRDATVADWVRQYTELTAREPSTGVALAGAILAWSSLHGPVSLESAGQFKEMGHKARTLLRAQISILAGAFGF